MFIYTIFFTDLLYNVIFLLKPRELHGSIVHYPTLPASSRPIKYIHLYSPYITVARKHNNSITEKNRSTVLTSSLLLLCLY